MSEALCEPLAVEDYGVQPMADASPPKWHLAHTSWFFETFLLAPSLPGYREFHPLFEHLFNSYYNGVGEPYPRAKRGHLSRPTVADVLAYRRHVDAAMTTLLSAADPDVTSRTILGLNHEQQHQELLLTDLKYNFGHNPLKPAYIQSGLKQPGRLTESDGTLAGRDQSALTFTSHPGGVAEIGAAEGAAFTFDNETPRHRVYLEPFALADRLVTAAEYLEFMEDGGYETPSLWLSDGWSWVVASGVRAPLYWWRQDGVWQEYRLTGAGPVAGPDPVTHVSAYEADAFARWAGFRLPSEAEWEVQAERLDEGIGNFMESGLLHPAPAAGGRQLFGDAWEWTASAYGPFPGYRPLPGTLGEYNGKFMSNQLVLRGGSCVTPEDHIRSSYRNFFYPPDRWQFTGIRLARDDG